MYDAIVLFMCMVVASRFRTKRRLAGPFAPGMTVSSKLFAVSHDAKLVFSGGHWDNSLRVYNISKAKTVAVVVRHTGRCNTILFPYKPPQNRTTS